MRTSPSRTDESDGSIANVFLICGLRLRDDETSHGQGMGDDERALLGETLAERKEAVSGL